MLMGCQVRYMPARSVSCQEGDSSEGRGWRNPVHGWATETRFWSQLCHKQTLSSFHWDHRVHVGKHERTELEVSAETGSLWPNVAHRYECVNGQPEMISDAWRGALPSFAAHHYTI